MEHRRVSIWSFLLAFLVVSLAAAPLAAASWQPLSLWGGDVRLAAAVSDPSVVYAVTPAAGLFQSTDRGATWHFVAYPPDRLEIRAIAVDPHNPQRLLVTVWVPSPAFTYQGFYRSEDGGRHWRRTTVPAALTVFDAAFDPETRGVVYAATSRGLFRSRNGGNSWARIAFTGSLVEKVAVALSDPDVLLASVFQDNRRTTWRSTDGGQTFAEVLPQGMAGFVFDPARPRRVYGFDSTATFVSDDLGATWSARNEIFTILALGVTPSGTLVSGGYEGGIRRSTDAGETWAPALGQPARPEDAIFSLVVLGERVLAGGARGVWRSEAGGLGWRASSTGLRAHTFTALEVGGDGTVWAATQAGVFLGHDEGESLQLLRGLGPRAYLQLLAVHPRRSDVAYAFGCCGEDEDGNLVGGLIKTEDGGATWQALPYTGVTREPAVVEVDPVDPDIVYAGGFVQPHAGACTATRSTDGGATWSCMASLGGRDFYVLAIDPRRPQNLFAGVGGELYHSTDRGTTWTKVQTRNGGFGRLEVDPFRSERLYGTGSNSLFRSDNGGRTWTSKFAVLPGGFVHDILLDPQRKNRIWLTAEYYEIGNYKTTSRVFHSDDAGEHWTEVSRGLRAGTVLLDLAADPASADVIYAGSEGQGMFRLRVEQENP
jgi:photosystem II stability/assembly factor-like uncharacterized protein